MAKQTIQGKGFEYACLESFYNTLKINNMKVKIEENKAVSTARNLFHNLPSEQQDNMLLAANASVEPVLNSEPNLINGDETITLSIQVDERGAEGDVRDIILLKDSTGWEIGISCKHNHHALKHSRLSSDIDFGKKWFGYSCSKEYFSKVDIIFNRLRDLRNATKSLDKVFQNKWDKILDKESEVYVPVLDAFKQELLRLTVENPDVPLKLVEYLLGRKDFYKVISVDKERRTIIQAFNLHNTLSENYGQVKARNKTKSFNNILPRKIYDFDYKSGSKNTLILVMDNGWTISFRIHNASSRIEPSLKFDIQLVGIPQSVSNQEEYWKIL
ncbi:HaeIII family restriction endonuclease [Lactococcus lactis]|uniref:HaeIII family restriction endonuclease n=1 Tax=Lactococcus lactis TaxID=1358 RepID=UPI001898ABAB|nr:HaeIII family restriction endonuclease [Lactococcus lactis]